MGSLQTKELEKNQGSAGGNGIVLKIGHRSGNLEFGIFNSSQRFKVDVDHDSESNTINYKLDTLGGYLTFYTDSFYIEGGYGKTTVEEKLDSSLSSAAQQIIKDIYNLDDSEKSINQAHLQLGYKIFNVGSSGAFTVFAQKMSSLNSTHTSTFFGFEFKLSF